MIIYQLMLGFDSRREIHKIHMLKVYHGHTLSNEAFL